MKLPKTGPGYVDDPRQRDTASSPQVGMSAGDEVFYRRSGSHCVGTILCHGRDGFTIRGQGGPHVKVPWPDYVGHKTRVNHQARIVHQGEDGALADLEDGRRVYLFGYPHMAEEEPELKKATILLLKAGPIKNRPGLTLKPIADKAGRQSKHWVKTGKDQKKPRAKSKGDPEDIRGAAVGYGTQIFKIGQAVQFDNGQGGEQSGTIVSKGKDGVVVETPHGRQQIKWDQIRKPPGDGGDGKGGDAGEHKRRGEYPPEGGNWRQMPAKVKPDEFSAKAHYDSTDQDVTEEQLFDELNPEQRAQVLQAMQDMVGLEKTIATHKSGGNYTPERARLHNKIIYGSDERDAKGKIKYPGFLTEAKIKAATPAAGERPTATFLGGRGGSGKGSFKGRVYEEGKAITLDADDIKRQLPEYAGWNAGQVHEESGDILDTIRDESRKLGLHVTVDATMKTPAKAREVLNQFRGAGYHTAGHFMHLSRAEAARRSLQRFFGDQKRLVLPDIILGNTQNEAGFDAIRSDLDEWSFWDNHGDDAPHLISHSHAGKA